MEKNNPVYLVSIAGLFIEMSHEQWLDYREQERYFYQSILEDNEDIVHEIDCGRVYYNQHTDKFRAVSWHTGQDIIFNNKHDAIVWLRRQ